MARFFVLVGCFASFMALGVLLSTAGAGHDCSPGLVTQCKTCGTLQDFCGVVPADQIGYAICKHGFNPCDYQCAGLKADGTPCVCDTGC